MGLEKFARGVNANFGGMRGGAMRAGAAGNNGRPRNSAVIQARIGGSGITHSGQGRNWAFPAHIEALNNFISESRVIRRERRNLQATSTRWRHYVKLEAAEVYGRKIEAKSGESWFRFQIPLSSKQDNGSVSTNSRFRDRSLCMYRTAR